MRGLDFEGIYRKSGSKSQVDSILDYFGGDLSSESALHGDISAVTSAVKQYLRYLAIPVIPFDYYDSFISARDDVKAMQEVCQTLPENHFVTLQAIIRHLSIVASHGDTNLMTPHNLAVVFAPTLVRDESGRREIEDMNLRSNAAQLLITNCDLIFKID